MWALFCGGCLKSLPSSPAGASLHSEVSRSPFAGKLLAPWCPEKGTKVDRYTFFISAYGQDPHWCLAWLPFFLEPLCACCAIAFALPFCLGSRGMCARWLDSEARIWERNQLGFCRESTAWLKLDEKAWVCVLFCSVLVCDSGQIVVPFWKMNVKYICHSTWGSVGRSRNHLMYRLRNRCLSRRGDVAGSPGLEWQCHGHQNPSLQPITSLQDDSPHSVLHSSGKEEWRRLCSPPLLITTQSHTQSSYFNLARPYLASQRLANTRH